MFELVTKRKAELKADNRNRWFVEIEDAGVINQHNYDAIREVIMRQNLIFEPLIVEDEYTQKVIDKAVKVRNKSGGDFDFQSMLVMFATKNKSCLLKWETTHTTNYVVIMRCFNV